MSQTDRPNEDNIAVVPDSSGPVLDGATPAPAHPSPSTAQPVAESQPSAAAEAASNTQATSLEVEAAPPSADGSAPDPSSPPSGAWLPTRLPGWLGWLLLDLALPLLGYVLYVAHLGRGILKRRDEILIGGEALAPGDFNGTVWFYWWVQQSLVQGKRLLHPDVVCAPGGQDLGSNFPNRVDAFLAFPFFSLFPFPTSYNLFLLLVPIVGAACAYWGLRALTRSRLMAWAGGLFFGVNAYTFYELRGGRPATALVFTLPLFLAALAKALGSQGRRAYLWAGLAGVAAALTVNAYTPFALWLALVALIYAWVSRRERPGRHPARQVAGILAVIAAVTLGLSGPYLYEAVVVRGILTTRAPVAPMPGSEGTLQTGMPGPGGVQPGASGMSLPAFEVDESKRYRPPRVSWDHRGVREVQRDSLPWDFIKGFQRDTGLKERWLAPLPFLLLAGLALLSGRRARGWLALSAFFYLILLGPYLATGTPDNLSQLKPGGQAVPLPLLFILYVVPPVPSLFRPFRVFPFMLLFLAAAVACGMEGLSRRLEARVRTRPFWLARGLPLLPMLLGAVLCVWHVEEIRRSPTLRMPFEAWKPPAFLRELAKSKEDFIVAELPLGMGHATAVYQLLHQKRRTEGHHDLLPFAVSGGMLPGDCYTLKLVASLWLLGREGNPPDRVPPPITPEQVAEARQANLRYVLVYPKGYELLAREGGKYNVDQVLQTLEAALGPPLVKEESLVVFPVGGK